MFPYNRKDNMKSLAKFLMVDIQISRHHHPLLMLAHKVPHLTSTIYSHWKEIYSQVRTILAFSIQMNFSHIYKHTKQKQTFQSVATLMLPESTCVFVKFAAFVPPKTSRLFRAKRHLRLEVQGIQWNSCQGTGVNRKIKRYLGGIHIYCMYISSRRLNMDYENARITAYRWVTYRRQRPFVTNIERRQPGELRIPSSLIRGYGQHGGMTVFLNWL